MTLEFFIYSHFNKKSIKMPAAHKANGSSGQDGPILPVLRCPFCLEPKSPLLRACFVCLWKVLILYNFFNVEVTAAVCRWPAHKSLKSNFFPPLSNWSLEIIVSLKPVWRKLSKSFVTNIWRNIFIISLQLYGKLCHTWMFEYPRFHS